MSNMSNLGAGIATVAINAAIIGIVTIGATAVFRISSQLIDNWKTKKAAEKSKDETALTEAKKAKVEAELQIAKAEAQIAEAKAQKAKAEASVATLKLYTFSYNKGKHNYDGTFEYVCGLTHHLIASSEQKAIEDFYNFQGVDEFSDHVIFEFISIKETELNPCGKMPHVGCFDCQNCPGPI